jgi:excisionase family DNA binding protein
MRPAQEYTSDDLLTVEQLARYLSVSTKTIDRKVSDGTVIRPMLVAGQKRWRWSDVQRWVDALATLTYFGVRVSDEEKESAD